MRINECVITMSRSKISALILTAFAACCFCIGVAVSLLDKDGKVTLEPENLEIADDPLQYETVSVHLRLTNRSQRAVRIANYITSCSCTKFLGADGKELPPGSEIPPDGAFPCAVNIDTGGRLGPQEFKVMCQIESDGRIQNLISTIKMRVRQGFQFDPESVQFGEALPGTQLAGEVRIFDSYPGPGVRFDAAASDASRIKTELVSLATDRPANGIIEQKHTTDARQHVLKPRFLLKINYLVPDVTFGGEVNDFVMLVPNGGQLPRFKIPILCRTRRPLFRINPSMIPVFPSMLGSETVRTLRLIFDGNIERTAEIVHAPAFVTLTIKRTGSDAMDLEARLNLTDKSDLQSAQYISLQIGGPNGDRVDIPVRLINL